MASNERKEVEWCKEVDVDDDWASQSVVAEIVCGDIGSPNGMKACIGDLAKVVNSDFIIQRPD